MKVLRVILLIVGIACTVVFCMVNYVRTQTADGETSELRVGFYPSPWIRHEAWNGPKKVGTHSEVGLINLSTLFGVAAMLSFLGYARMGNCQGGRADKKEAALSQPLRKTGHNKPSHAFGDAMIDGARDTLRWVWRLITHASPAMKVLYVMLLCALFTVAVIFVPFVNNLSDYFSKSNPLVQLFILLFLIVSVIASVLFAYDRGHRVDQLKEKNNQLEKDLNELGEQLITMQTEWAEKLKSAQSVSEQLESRWNALADVESRQNIWQRPWAAANFPFVAMEQRGTRTRFLSIINLKGGVGKTTLSANLAACLAFRDQPLRVLVVDLDFQGSLSNHTVDPQMVQMQAANRNTVVRLMDAGFDSRNLNGLMTPMFKVPGVKVVLANDELESVDYRLQAEYFVKSDREVRFLFRQHLHSPVVFHQFDLIIFDCPPRLTTSAVNALACSDFVLIPTKLDQDSIISVPRTIKWLDLLAGVVPAQLVGVVANDVSVRAGRLTQADQNSYNYLCEVVAQWRAGNREFVFQSKIKSDAKIPPNIRGVVACAEDANRELFKEFVGELTRRINL